MTYRRKIYIDPKLAQEACDSIESLDALALVLSIKHTFVDSIVKDGSATNVMRIFRIGYTRYNRAVNYALKHKWLTRQGKSLVACKIKTEGAYNIVMRFGFNNRQKNEEVKAAYTLTQMRNFIREAVILFHISKQAVVYDTITMATHPSKRTSQAAYRNAKKRAESWGMCKPKLKRKGNRFSYARMSEIASCSKSKAKSLVKTLVNCNIVDKRENYERTRYSIDEYSKVLRDNYAQFGKRGFLVRHDGRVMLRLANSYSLNRNVVKFVVKPA